MLSTYFLPLLISLLWTNTIKQPEQALTGPGSSEYTHEEIRIQDFADEPHGYWLYEPAAPQPDSAHLVIFTHGYGAINPMIYGAWIRHLVRKGNIVVFPRYQKNLTNPRPSDFPANVSQAIKDALLVLEQEGHVKPYAGRMSLVGHSYGGVISANLGVNYERMGLPFPEAIMLCSPGSGPFKGAVLEDYSGLPLDSRMLITVSERDHVVGDKFAKKVFQTSPQLKKRNLLRQFGDKHGEPRITAGHNECHGLDKALDGDIHNISTRKAIRNARTNPVDYYGYWKLFDALLDCTRKDENCHIAFGDTPEQKDMGTWSDGTAIRPFEVLLPDLK